MRSGRVVDLRKSKAGAIFRCRFPHAVPSAAARLCARDGGKCAHLFFGSLLLIAGIVYGVSVVSYLPRFSIQTVEVNGAKEISASSIRSFVEAELYDGSRPILSRNNIFLYPRATIEQAVVDNFPRIRTVSVSRPSLLAQTVTVVVEEREPYARWCEGGECYLIDDGGFIFSQASTSAETLRTSYIFTGPTGTSTPSIGESGSSPAASLTSWRCSTGSDRRVGMRKAFPSRMSRILRSDCQRCQGRRKPAGLPYAPRSGMTGEATVKILSSCSRPMPCAAGNRSSNMDLRFGNRVYYKLKGKEQQSTE